MKLTLPRILAFLLFSVSISAHATELDLTRYKGKLVYVDFWASWCGPCRASFPFMNDLVKKYGDQLAVVSVNLDEERQDANDFLEEIPADFSVIYDPEGGLAKQYGVRGMPNSFLFDRSGKLVSRHDGFTVKDPQHIRELIDNTLGKSQ